MARVTIAELTKKLDECKELSNQRENEIITLKCVIDRVESEKVALELKLSDLSDTDEIRHQYHRVTAELLALRNESIAKESQLTELTAAYNNLQMELKTKQDQFVKDKDECLHHIDFLKSEINNKSSHLRDAESLRNGLTATINELNKELDEVKTKFKVAAVLAVSVTLSFLAYIVLF